MHHEKLSTYQQGIVTIELLWQSLMPHIPAPHPKFTKAWVHHYSFEQINEGLAQVARFIESKGITDADVAGRIATSALRKRYGSDNVRALHLDL